MKNIVSIATALVSLARLVKGQPNEKAKIEAAQKGIAEDIKGAGRRNLLDINDELVMMGFSSKSEAMEPDGKGGMVWNPELTQVYVDAQFRFLEVLGKSQVPQSKEVCREILWRAVSYANIVFFCRQLKVKEPLPNLLSFEGRNKAALILRPMMAQLTEDILSLLNQAKELSKTGRHDEAKGARDRAEKLNQLYGRMDKTTLPQLEKQDPQALTLGKTLDKEGSPETVATIIHAAMKESGMKKSAS